MAAAVRDNRPITIDKEGNRVLTLRFSAPC